MSQQPDSPHSYLYDAARMLRSAARLTDKLAARTFIHATREASDRALQSQIRANVTAALARLDSAPGNPADADTAREALARVQAEQDHQEATAHDHATDGNDDREAN